MSDSVYQLYQRYYTSVSPSTVHTKNTESFWYFFRYLYQKFLSVIKFTNLPEDWDIDYFRAVLFLRGFLTVFDTDEFGVIPQDCSLSGYNLFYKPTKTLIANPVLKNYHTHTIGTDCEIIKIMPDYCGIGDIIAYYADLMALYTESIGMAAVNSKFSYVFAAGTNSIAESLKALYDQIQEGNPAVVADKKLFDADGRLRVQLFDQALRNNYIGHDLLQDLTQIEIKYNNEIGIPNSNFSKLSGVSELEVNANNIDTRSKLSTWIEEINRGCDKVNAMFGLSISCDYSFDYEYSDNSEGGEEDDRENIASDAV